MNTGQGVADEITFPGCQCMRGCIITQSLIPVPNLGVGHGLVEGLEVDLAVGTVTILLHQVDWMGHATILQTKLK